MSFSEPFIRRPVATTLLAAGLFLFGGVAYRFLPVASLPAIDFPSIHVSASRPGADPETMAATVAAPLERHLGEIAGVNELTSVSSLGATSISIQFDLDRNIDGAARDVQAALNAAATDLPADLPTLPTFRKSNPSAAPITILAMTSDTLPAGAIYDAADTVVAQRISQVAGVAEVLVGGAEQPAVRVRVNPALMSQRGIGMDSVEAAITSANSLSPVGVLDGQSRQLTLRTNDQLMTVEGYSQVAVRSADGALVRLTDIGSVVEGVRNELMAGWYGTKPAVLIIVFKQANANVIETVDSIRTLVDDLRHWIPAGIRISFLTDRTITIRAGFEDLQLTILISVMLVMLVVLLFLRRLLPTAAAGIAVPLSLAGTLLAMWAVGFSLDNLSLMALTVSVGFVVDDAIVMIENAFRNMEAGLAPFEAAIAGARQIGFTVASISVSLAAAFIPLLFMGGIIGRLFREFSVTLVIAIAVSAVVSLTVTPMICAKFGKAPRQRLPGRFPALARGFGSRTAEIYRRSLSWALRHSWLMLGVTVATVALTVFLYAVAPKGFFPVDDTGMVMAMTESSASVSFKTMKGLQERVANTILADPAVDRLGSFVGASGGNSSLNQGRIFMTLKPLAERKDSVFAVIDRLRRQLGKIPGISVFMTPMQDLRIGARAAKADYQYTLWDNSLGELTQWLPRVMERVKQIPGFLDVSTDRESGGLQADVEIDRTQAARLGVSVQLIDDALDSAFSQRQLSTMYTERNQYHVILEVEPEFRQDPAALGHIFVASASGAQVPLSAVARFGRSSTPLVVNHQGQFPAITITFNLAEGVSLSQASSALTQAIQGLHAPSTLHGEFAGTTQAFQQSLQSEPLLILAALIAMYIILGVLYESLLHPITILSTLPSAGIGALLALRLTGTDLTLIALVGVILLMGIVKKNGIMLVDFALEAERERGLSPEAAILEASLTRFRPIMMTTMAALFGAIPLILVTGNGAELRRPLGITIVGGLVLSQLLTLYTTPVIYLLLDRLSWRFRRRRRAKA